MKVRSLLKQAGISELAYAALMRQGLVSFMRKRSAGRGTFQREHLVALKAFELLRSLGLQSAVAGTAVDAAFPAIRKFVTSGRLRSAAQYKVGARLLTVRGKVVMQPLGEPIAPGAAVLGNVELDIRGVDALLPPELAEMIAQSESDVLGTEGVPPAAGK